MNALEISHLIKRYGKNNAVNNLSLDIREGDFFGFLGPNGAGKSTAINCITGIGRFNSGTIHVYGHDVVKDYRKARKMVGLSPQEFNIDIFAPVTKILWFVGGYYGLSRAQRNERIPVLLKKFDLEQHKDKEFRMLSGGLKRRVMIARALIHDPELLILDEPTAGVDVELRHELWGYLRDLNNKGKTILLTSHYLEEVELLCNKIGIINNGVLVDIGDKAKFISDGKTLEKKYLEMTKK